MLNFREGFLGDYPNEYEDPSKLAGYLDQVREEEGCGEICTPSLGSLWCSEGHALLRHSCYFPDIAFVTSAVPQRVFGSLQACWLPRSGVCHPAWCGRASSPRPRLSIVYVVSANGGELFQRDAG